MSEENVEIAHQAFEAASRRPKPDFDTVNALFHPDHELVSLVSFRQGELQGAEGFRDFLTSMGEAYGSWEVELEEARALGVGDRPPGKRCHFCPVSTGIHSHP